MSIKPIRMNIKPEGFAVKAYRGAPFDIVHLSLKSTDRLLAAMSGQLSKDANAAEFDFTKGSPAYVLRHNTGTLKQVIQMGLNAEKMKIPGITDVVGDSMRVLLATSPGEDGKHNVEAIVQYGMDGAIPRAPFIQVAPHRVARDFQRSPDSLGPGLTLMHYLHELESNGGEIAIAGPNQHCADMMKKWTKKTRTMPHSGDMAVIGGAGIIAYRPTHQIFGGNLTAINTNLGPIKLQSHQPAEKTHKNTGYKIVRFPTGSAAAKFYTAWRDELKSKKQYFDWALGSSTVLALGHLEMALHNQGLTGDGPGTPTHHGLVDNQTGEILAICKWDTFPPASGETPRIMMVMEAPRFHARNAGPMPNFGLALLDHITSNHNAFIAAAGEHYADTLRQFSQREGLAPGPQVPSNPTHWHTVTHRLNAEGQLVEVGG